MPSIADKFAAELAELQRRSAETDKRMSETLARIHTHLAEFKRLDKELTQLEAKL